MANKKYFYNDFDGKKVEYVLEKGLSLSQRMSLWLKWQEQLYLKKSVMLLY